MKKLTAPLLALAATLALTSVFCMSFNAGVAHAQALDAGSAMIGSGSGSAVAAAPPDLTSPTEALSTASKLYHSGAFFSLAIVVLFVGLRLADKKIPYLQEGKHGVYTAAALGGLALLAMPIAQGTTPNLQMFTTALATAVALVLNPQKTGTTPG